MHGCKARYALLLQRPSRAQALIRIDPAKMLGLEEGDAHVIRNAGGRTIEALRSVTISQQLLGTREIVVIHHVCHCVPCLGIRRTNDCLDMI